MKEKYSKPSIVRVNKIPLLEACASNCSPCLCNTGYHGPGGVGNPGSCDCGVGGPSGPGCECYPDNP